VVLVLSVIFYFAYIPDIRSEDDYHLDDSVPSVSHSIWTHPHFVLAVAAQFLYVAAQAGIFSFFINYMTAEVPAIPDSWNSIMTRLADHAGFLHNWLVGWFETSKDGVLCISNKGASNLASLGFVCFLVGRFTGAGLLRRFSAHKVLGLYGLLNVLACLVVFLKLGWLSVACVFLSYFFMSIMFPTIFALGIFGLGARAKKASAFIVMAIMGGAVLPKLMGAVADQYDMSRGFIVPMVCFAMVALYGFGWPKLSHADSLHGTAASVGH
jgi:FHS family L-fucose permease-like MFS transporter